MQNQEIIGRVIATEKKPTTTSHVRFWLEPHVQLKPFDFVRFTPPESQEIDIGEFWAIISEIEQVSDEPSPISGFISADFGDSKISPRASRVVTTYADAMVLYNTQGIEMPVPHGSKVQWPDERGVQTALGILDFKRPIPAGYITMSGPGKTAITINAKFDADYLIGPEGAHLNISGISGLATKTSYAMFLVTAIQQQERDRIQDADEIDSSRSAFLIFNVKGTDLLRLHEPPDHIPAETISDWKKCGLSATPLTDVVYYYPYSDKEPNAQTKLEADQVSQNIANGIAYRYYYDVQSALGNIRLLMEDISDPNHTLTSCTEHCIDHIRPDQAWTAFRRQLREWSNSSPVPSIPVVSWRRFTRLFIQRTRNHLFTEQNRKSTSLKQVPLSQILQHLQPGKVVVVDIAQLPDYIQSFVVGHTLDLIRRAKLGDDDALLTADEVMENTPTLGTLIVVADELNKFAPSHGQDRSITRHLREISERGRSEGIVLFGAEQFRTGVDRQVTGNCSTIVFGRTTAVEANRDSETKGLLGTQSKRVPFLGKGELLVSHTRFSSGTLKLRFPRNAYRQG